jgi:hypothetical protein
MPSDGTVATTELQNEDPGGSSDRADGGAADADADVLEQWLELATTGQRTASGTVRKFVHTVDRLVPVDGVGLAKRREVISAALEMTQRLAHMPYGLGRSLVRSAVLVNVNVDVDIASRAATTLRSSQEDA